MLTHQEKLIIQQLAVAWNLFLALPTQHPDDQKEFRTMIHAAQDKVLARSGHREITDSFR